jgi:two-component system, LytTR family, sensor histidine kinase AlgZ
MTTRSATSPVDHNAPGVAGYLPDFCNIRVVFIIVISAELLAFILALGTVGGTAARWHALSQLSLFIQWIALSCTALLCVGRHWLNRLGPVGAGTGAWLLVLLVTVLMSEIVFQLGRGSGIAQLIPAQPHVEFLLRNLAVAAIFGAVILRYFYIQGRTRETIEAESRARFQALQARIRPHFMFNSMNTIASLTRSNPALAEEIVEDLAELFRVSLSDSQRHGTLGEEIELVRRYLRIEGLRLGARLEVEERLKDLPLEARIPALLLQPLVENAVYHGIEPLPEGGVIRIVGTRRNGLIMLTVSNPLPLPRAGVPAGRRAGHHMAIDNIRERLRLNFGQRGRLEISTDDGWFTARVEFPYLTETEAEAP